MAFDLDSNGSRDRIAWTRANSPIAFLALDRNNNGQIDDGSELFGTSTKKRDGSLADNGFEALEDLDGGPGVSDGRIDSHDGIFAQLRLWLDDNHDGRSTPNELTTLSQAGVAVIFTEYRESRRQDRHGNKYKYVGRISILKHGEYRARRAFDVFFASL